jgi:hypothetical protein
MSQIRAFTPDDLPAVAGLFQKTFRKPRTSVPASLVSCLGELFLDHPWHDPELPSRVYVTDDGAVGGFIGVLPLHMSYRGKPVRAAVPSSIMVDRPEADPLAGAKLLRSFLAGPQDLSVSEPTSLLVQRMWQRVGGQSVPSESMEWLRVFRPAGLAVAVAGAKVPAVRFARPVAGLMDRIAVKAVAALRVEPHPNSFQRDADVGDDELLQLIPEFAATYPLHPDWDPACLKWQIAHAARNTDRGTLFRRVVYGKGGAPLGCYLYHGRRREVGFVLQILARPEATGAVLDSLLAHAQEMEMVALKGRTQLRLLDPLLERNAVFFRRNSAVAHSRNPELLAAIRSGESLTVGLASDAWTRLIGGVFT